MFTDNSRNPDNFVTSMPTATLQENGFQPEFCQLVLTFDVNVWRFIPITRKEKESISTNPNAVGISCIQSYIFCGGLC